MTNTTTSQTTFDTSLDELVAAAASALDDLPAFRARQFDLGLAWVHFAPGQGGLGLDPDHQSVIAERLLPFGIGSPFMSNPMGIGMVAPTIAAHGTVEQQQRFLRSIFTAEEIWCQLFSEPSAGSDVASSATQADRDGESWTVSGQKVWTSLGHMAAFGLLLARTDPDVPKHKGMTCFIVDMHAPGVDVRPLRQMTGDAEFNEVFFDGVHIDDAMRVGDIGDGWRVAITTLMNERVAIGGATPPRGTGPIATALDCWAKNPERHTATNRDRLAQLWIEAETLRLTNVRAQAKRSIGVPGPEGSIGKLAQCEFYQRLYNFCVDLLGPAGTLLESGYAARAADECGESDIIIRSFLRSRANTIEGGTSEIMRNILGERVLGLPGDVRVDRDVAWRDVARS